MLKLSSVNTVVYVMIFTRVLKPTKQWCRCSTSRRHNTAILAPRKQLTNDIVRMQVQYCIESEITKPKLWANRKHRNSIHTKTKPRDAAKSANFVWMGTSGPKSSKFVQIVTMGLKKCQIHSYGCHQLPGHKTYK
jgi:hypothetical protein